jgi:uncharacterized protein
MLSFDLRALESRAAIVDEELADDDPVWQAEDLVPAGPVRVTGRLSAAGPGRFYWHGKIEGEVVMPCRRCLNEAAAHVSDEAHVIFAETESEETDDPDVYRLDPRAREVDLGPVIREQWLLNVPSYALCRDDCKGLCSTCGAELNVARCECRPAIHSVWDALRKQHTKSD